MTSEYDDLSGRVRTALLAESEAAPVDLATAAQRLRSELVRSGRRRRRRAVAVPVLAAALVAVVTGALELRGAENQPAPAPPAHQSPTPTYSPVELAGDVVVVDLSGRVLQNVPGLPADAILGSLSPNGSRIAFTTGGSVASRVGTIGTDGSDPRLLTAFGLYAVDPAWSPDGSTIAFASEPASGPGPQFELYVMAADGSDVRRLTEPSALPYWSFAAQPQWSPDGSTIVYTRGTEPDTGHGWTGQTWTVPATGGAQTRLTGRLSADERDPTYSPDGTRLAYVRDGGIWVMDSDGTNPRRLVADGTLPRWSPDGEMIAYLTTQAPSGTSGTTTTRLDVVDVATGSHRRVDRVVVGTGAPVWWSNDAILVRHWPSGP